MRRLSTLIFIVIVVGAYLHYVQGWDWARARREPIVTYFFPEDASATTTPIGERGVGTHWERVRPMPSARTEFGAAVAGNTIYVIGGVDGYWRTLSSVLAYDIGADAWRELPRLPQAIHHPAVASDGKKVYVIGGLTGIAARPVDDVYVFDPEKNAWELAGRLNDFRGAAAAAFLGDRLHVIGGITTAGVDGVFEYYVPERGGWNGLKSMPTSRADFAAVSAAGKIFAIGGRKGSVARSLASVDAYDAKELKWETAGELAGPRSGHSAVENGGKIYVFGGESKDGVVGTVETYDPKKKEWSRLDAPMMSPRHGLAAVPWKDRVYVIGGGRRAGFSVSDLNEVLILADGKK